MDSTYTRDTPPTWMIDGKPGQILDALVKAVKAVKPLEKRGNREMTYLNIDDVKLAVKHALNEQGIVTRWETLGNPLIDTGKAPFCVVEVRCTFIAPDGSYIVSTIKGGGQAGMGRSLTVATTAAVKQILGLTLQLATGDDERAEPPPPDDEEWSDNLRAVVGALNAAQDNEDIKRVGAMSEAKALGPRELPIAHHYGRERRKELVLLAQSLAATANEFKPDEYKPPKKVRP